MDYFRKGHLFINSINGFSTNSFWMNENLFTWEILVIIGEIRSSDSVIHSLIMRFNTFIVFYITAGINAIRFKSYDISPFFKYATVKLHTKLHRKEQYNWYLHTYVTMNLCWICFEWCTWFFLFSNIFNMYLQKNREGYPA